MYVTCATYKADCKVPVKRLWGQNEQSLLYEK